MEKLSDFTSGRIASTHPKAFTWYAIAVTVIIIILVIVLIVVKCKKNNDTTDKYSALGPTYPTVARKIIGGDLGAGNVKNLDEAQSALMLANTGTSNIGTTAGSNISGIPGIPQT
jgi:hypothetical protein